MMLTSQFWKTDTYDRFCASGSHIRNTKQCMVGLLIFTTSDIRPLKTAKCRILEWNINASSSFWVKVSEYSSPSARRCVCAAAGFDLLWVTNGNSAELLESRKPALKLQLHNLRLLFDWKALPPPYLCSLLIFHGLSCPLVCFQM